MSYTNFRIGLGCTSDESGSDSLYFLLKFIVISSTQSNLQAQQLHLFTLYSYEFVIHC